MTPTTITEILDKHMIRLLPSLAIALLMLGCTTVPESETKDLDPHSGPYCANRTVYYGDVGGIYILCVHEFLEENPQYRVSERPFIADTAEARAAWYRWAVKNVYEITGGKFQPK